MPKMGFLRLPAAGNSWLRRWAVKGFENWLIFYKPRAMTHGGGS
jgi:hypothetical protein